MNKRKFTFICFFLALGIYALGGSSAIYSASPTNAIVGQSLTVTITGNGGTHFSQISGTINLSCQQVSSTIASTSISNISDNSIQADRKSVV